jgi:hypothetical protein
LARFIHAQKLGKHVKFVREIVREIAGYNPLERRAIELLRNGRDKRCLKLCKKRVGDDCRLVLQHSDSMTEHAAQDMRFFVSSYTYHGLSVSTTSWKVPR